MYAFLQIVICPGTGASPPMRVRSRRPPRPNQGTSIVRIRFALALMVAGMLFAAGIASAQDTTTTTTEPLSGYTQTTTTQTQPAQTTEGTTTEAAPDTQAQEETSVAPSVAAQPAGSAPSTLAFTGGEPLLLIALGLALAGGTAVLLVRDRRRSQD
jgi:predicted PurR-regulated permease PerM